MHNDIDFVTKVNEFVAKYKETKNTQRAVEFLYQDKKMWIKFAASGEKNFWHTILRIVFFITKNPFFAPTVVLDGKKSLEHEAKVLGYLKSQSVCVPEVFFADSDFLVLGDCGVTIHRLLGLHQYSTANKDKILRQVSKTMAILHNKGIYHSRPALRDIAIDANNNICLLDFEEDVEKYLTKEQAITRDIVLYIHALYRKVLDVNLRDSALQTYKDNLSADKFLDATNALRGYKWLYAVLGKIYKRSGKDAKALFWTLKFFRSNEDQR